MPDPILITDASCDDCDMCCVLGKSTPDDGAFDCTKLGWLCRCPTGALLMQQRPSGGSWADIPGWAEDGPGFYYPWHNSFTAAPDYRMKCTLADGTIYYSNIVGLGKVHPDCYCFDSGSICTLGADVNWTWRQYDTSDTLLSTTTGTTGLTCPSSTANILVEAGWTLKATWGYDGSSNYRITVEQNRFPIPDNTHLAQSLRSSWVQEYRCYSAKPLFSAASVFDPLPWTFTFRVPASGGTPAANYSIVTVDSIVATATPI